MKSDGLRQSELSYGTGTARDSVGSLTERPRLASALSPVRSDLGLGSQDLAVLQEEGGGASKREGLLERYFPIQSPYNSALIVWNIIVVVNLVYILAEMPVTIFFGENFFYAYVASSAFVPVYVLLIAILCVNAFVTLSCGYFEDGLLFMGRAEVMRHYFLWHFFPDVLTIAAILMVLISQNYYVNLGKAVVVVKFLQLYELDLAFRRIFQFLRLRKMLYFGLRMVVIMFLCCNYIGPVFYFIDLEIISSGIYGANTATFTWLNNNSALPGSMLDYPFKIQYLETMYWALNMVSQICIGNIAPMNPYETLYFFYLLMLSTLVYTYLINLVIEIVAWVRKRVKAFFYKLITINLYMARRGISEQLQAEVRACIQYIWYQEKDRDTGLEADVIEQLPEILKEDLKAETYHYFLQPFKQLGYPTLFLKELAEFAQERRYASQEPIYLQGSEDDDYSLYYVVQGQVRLKFQNEAGQKFLLASYGEKQIFGWKQFLQPGPRSLSMYAQSECMLFVLAREDYLKVARLDLNYYHASQVLHSKISMAKKYALIDLKCAECKSYDHLVETCPILHYSPRVVYVKQKRRQAKRPRRARLPTHFRLKIRPQHQPKGEEDESQIERLIGQVDSLLQQLRQAESSLPNIERVYQSQMFELNWNISKLKFMRI